ncbi:hypothetical protein [Neoroseomonas soli]|uniref:Uncharacterized protein n=1 Tax=Neoroseomonas soli TaxID=1081025 RepID=A0A9X9WX74_9PROT|nr:hypothetical protein [Neoroseomonas soli]MBR0671753.1 hypothetical protein [Neoroseomonas soli]
MSDAPDLSVVIVSHGHEAMLPGCVASLAAALAGQRAGMTRAREPVVAARATGGPP